MSFFFSNLKELANKIEIPYYEVSAQENINVDSVFLNLIEKLAEQKHSNKEEDTIDVKEDIINTKIETPRKE